MTLSLTNSLNLSLIPLTMLKWNTEDDMGASFTQSFTHSIPNISNDTDTDPNININLNLIHSGR
jgi:hypothetical protein